MPHYDYQCESCGNTFEVFHGMLETPAVKCPECNNNSKKMIGGGAGIIFKGSGFYKTDYNKSTAPSCENKNESSSKCACCPAGNSAINNS